MSRTWIHSSLQISCLRPCSVSMWCLVTTICCRVADIRACGEGKRFLFSHNTALWRPLDKHITITRIGKYYYTVVDWVRGHQQFCLIWEQICCPKPEAEVTDPFERQTKLPLTEKLVYNCFVIHLHFFNNRNILSFNSHPCVQYPCLSSLRIWTTPWHSEVNIT